MPAGNNAALGARAFVVQYLKLHRAVIKQYRIAGFKLNVVALLAQNNQLVASQMCFFLEPNDDFAAGNEMTANFRQVAYAEARPLQIAQYFYLATVAFRPFTDNFRPAR